MTVEQREIRTRRVPGEDDMTVLEMPMLDTTAVDVTVLNEELPQDRMSGTVSGELAARVRVLRRARRDAETRASRVRRVLLAPTAPAAAGGTRMREPKPHWH
ncbi:hypothetical protein [Actinomadura sp. 7K534]|uniref:hypothetical protein n=1 Tax=Actinomadura sp. 7K534 TaxID=2530366 RepID=UPI00104370D1|nr:hypothetical protein [Actinomadura sp. 7K534]TDB93284.1 hypothetical protein E1266_21020 [Actinomadura sp. 7K534]